MCKAMEKKEHQKNSHIGLTFGYINDIIIDKTTDNINEGEGYGQEPV